MIIHWKQVIKIPKIDIYGKGTSTKRLIEITEEYINKAEINYQNVWVVFGKDDFPDFGEAVKNGIRSWMSSSSNTSLPKMVTKKILKIFTTFSTLLAVWILPLKMRKDE